jgi:hypothetical protein
MTDKEIDNKWEAILMQASAISSNEMAFNLRVRYNPHHPKEDREAEHKAFMKDQIYAFMKMKAEYVAHREYLLKRVNNQEDPYRDKNYRKQFVEEIEKCVTDDMERILLS